jgi:hypothetical protein
MIRFEMNDTQNMQMVEECALSNQKHLPWGGGKDATWLTHEQKNLMLKKFIAYSYELQIGIDFLLSPPSLGGDT